MRGIGRLAGVAAIAIAAAASTAKLFKHTGYGPLHTRASGYRSILRLNRSQHWRRARTYAEARALSPFPDRPVR